MCTYEQGTERRQMTFDVQQRRLVRSSALAERVHPFAIGDGGIVARWPARSDDEGPLPLELVEPRTGKTRRIKSIVHYDMLGDVTSESAGPNQLAFGGDGKVTIVELAVSEPAK
jgi:hypothetical protein